MDVEKIMKISEVINQFNSDDNIWQENMTQVDACLRIEKILRQ